MDPLSLPSLKDIQSALIGMDQVEIKLEHIFTPGLYTRVCHIPAGTLLVTAIHRSEHPFAILTGRCRVFSENEGMVTYQAPYHGITKPDTKRLLYAEEETIWITYHATDLTDPMEIAAQIIEPEPLSDGVIPIWMQDALKYQSKHLES